MLKKIITIMLAVSICIINAGCGTDKNSSSQNKNTTVNSINWSAIDEHQKNIDKILGREARLSLSSDITFPKTINKYGAGGLLISSVEVLSVSANYIEDYNRFEVEVKVKMLNTGGRQTATGWVGYRVFLSKEGEIIDTGEIMFNDLKEGDVMTKTEKIYIDMSNYTIGTRGIDFYMDLVDVD